MSLTITLDRDVYVPGDHLLIATVAWRNGTASQRRRRGDRPRSSVAGRHCHLHAAPTGRAAGITCTDDGGRLWTKVVTASPPSSLA